MDYWEEEYGIYKKFHTYSSIFENWDSKPLLYNERKRKSKQLDRCQCGCINKRISDKKNKMIIVDYISDISFDEDIKLVLKQLKIKKLSKRREAMLVSKVLNT